MTSAWAENSLSLAFEEYVALLRSFGTIWEDAAIKKRAAGWEEFDEST